MMDTTETKATVNQWTEPIPPEAAGDETPQADMWFGDRPIWLALAVSGLAAAAAVPVILVANGGGVPVGKLLYAAVLVGLLVGTTSLLVAGLMVDGLRLVRAARSDAPQTEGKARSRGGLRGRLAFN